MDVYAILAKLIFCHENKPSNRIAGRAKNGI